VGLSGTESTIISSPNEAGEVVLELNGQPRQFWTYSDRGR
jgi:hypothetical protein